MKKANHPIMFGLMFLAASVSTAATIAIAPGASGAPGSEAEAAIVLRDARGLGSLQFELTYDPAVLEAREVSTGRGMPPMLLEYNEVAPGRMRVAMAGNEPLADEGQLAVKFFVKAAGASPLELEDARAWEQESGHDMLLLVESGQFDASARPLGGAAVWLAAVGAVVLILAILVLLMRRKRRQVA